VIAVIFEFWPAEAHQSEYFDLTAELRPMLQSIDGFISVERFESITTPGKFVSLSFWRDEAALTEWRRVAEHRVAQARGRGYIFTDYRLRVAEVDRDYGMHQREQAPADSRERHG
jgi:heme-degrading monooxygenase HmoA